MKQQFVRCLVIALLITVTRHFAMGLDEPLMGMDRFDHLKTLGKLVPRRSEDIAASPWGLQFNKHDFPMALMDGFLERIAESGVKWARVETRGFPIEYKDVKKKGYYRFGEFDKIIDGLNKRKIEIFITINTEPFSGLDSEDKPMDLKNLNLYLEYVTAIVRHYHDRVQYWEIDNEPKITVNYAELVKAASKVIKNIDPAAKVIAGSIARVNVEGVRLMLEDCGVGPYIDVITFHPYNEFPEGIKHNYLVPVSDGYQPSSPPVAEIFAILAKGDRKIALWQGECGYPSSEYTTSWKGRGPWGENIQGKWLLRRFLVDFSTGIPVNIYFLLREPPEDGRVNAKGLLVYGSWKPKIGYRALQHITTVFDQRFMTPRTVTAEFEVIDEGSFSGIQGENQRADEPFAGAKSPMPIQVIGLTGSGGDAVVYYTPWRLQEYVKPAVVNVRVHDVSIHDPVVVDLLTGKIYQAQTSIKGNDLIINKIPLTDYPIAIVSKKSCIH